MLVPGDSLLLGADIVKPRQQLLRAYDDPAGVTAAFNRNFLVRINRELETDFDLAAFAHKARFNENTSSVEMHLRSLKPQKVHVGYTGCEVTFEAGETIHTESSHKYTADELGTLTAAASFRAEAQWIDEEWPFSETLRWQLSRPGLSGRDRRLGGAVSSTHP